MVAPIEHGYGPSVYFPTWEQLPSDANLGPPQRRCCHGCMERRGQVWIACVNDDLTIWWFPFCRECEDLSIRYWQGEDLIPPPGLTTQQYAFLDRVEQWFENFKRWWSQRQGEKP